MRYIGYIILGALLLGLSAFGALWLSAHSSLDQSYSHSKVSAKLPFFGQISRNGLVRLKTDRGEFRARVAGFEAGEDRELVILLHGFPVTSAMWIDLIPALADAGYQVIAYDQRGYSPQVRPQDINDYQISEMVADLLSVADLTGSERFHLVGHDWGAAVGWAAVIENPSRIISWAPMSIAHPAAFGAALQNDPEQQSKSRYFAFFVTPMIPEIFFSFNEFQMLKALFGNMRSEKIEEYIQVFSEPGAISAGLNWYRAAFLHSELNQAVQPTRDNDVTVPTLFIWGNQDEAVGRRGTELMADYMKGPYSTIELDAGHWLLSDFPVEVEQLILSHLQSY